MIIHNAFKSHSVALFRILNVRAYCLLICIRFLLNSSLHYYPGKVSNLSSFIDYIDICSFRDISFREMQMSRLNVYSNHT